MENFRRQLQQVHGVVGDLHSAHYWFVEKAPALFGSGNKSGYRRLQVGSILEQVIHLLIRTPPTLLMCSYLRHTNELRSIYKNSHCF